MFSDRGDSSTFAFQVCGEEHNDLTEVFNLMRKFVLHPDLYVVFDLPAETARARVLRDANREKNHFDDRDLEYYKRVRGGFRKFKEYAPVNFVDATQSPEEVHQSVLRSLAENDVTMR